MDEVDKKRELSGCEEPLISADDNVRGRKK